MPSPVKLVLGMMSGTSADGIDAALVQISGAPPNLEINLLNHTQQSFPPEIRKEILRVAEQNPLTPGEFSQLHTRLAHIYAEAALAACRKFRISPEKIDLIGNHGQTIFHQGPLRSSGAAPLVFRGASFSSLPSTLQLGDGSIIANLTGVTTVSDFRPADMALGGHGAPLVPFADYALYRHPKLGRVSLNIGGIANVTVIPANAKPSNVFAFDTGPGNMLIDALVQHFTHNRQRYDKNALLAQKGHLHRELLDQLLGDAYCKLKPPKSTGREYFGAAYVKKLLTLGRRYHASRNDLIHTVTTFTAASVIDALHRFVFPKHKINEIIVSGGGAQNPLVFELLSVFAMSGAAPVDVYSADRPRKLSVRMLEPTGSETARGRFAKRRVPPHALISVVPSTRFGIPTDAKEALAFAILAYETFHRRPSNIPTATGARGPAILGKISYALPR
jgi:anhydro-N-acetylmuramic acid kinase